jgi:hypothetical protein
MSNDWLEAVRKSEEYQWQWIVALARRPRNKLSSDGPYINAMSDRDLQAIAQINSLPQKITLLSKPDPGSFGTA